MPTHNLLNVYVFCCDRKMWILWSTSKIRVACKQFCILQTSVNLSMSILIAPWRFTSTQKGLFCLCLFDQLFYYHFWNFRDHGFNFDKKYFRILPISEVKDIPSFTFILFLYQQILNESNSIFLAFEKLRFGWNREPSGTV